jgi:hypothetical protein
MRNSNATREYGVFHTKNCGSWHMWDKPCGFFCYNVQDVIFTMA